MLQGPLPWFPGAREVLAPPVVLRSLARPRRRERESKRKTVMKCPSVTLLTGLHLPDGSAAAVGSEGTLWTTRTPRWTPRPLDTRKHANPNSNNSMSRRLGTYSRECWWVYRHTHTHTHRHTQTHTHTQKQQGQPSGLMMKGLMMVRVCGGALVCESLKQRQHGFGFAHSDPALRYEVPWCASIFSPSDVSLAWALRFSTFAPWLYKPERELRLSHGARLPVWGGHPPPQTPGVTRGRARGRWDDRGLGSIKHSGLLNTKTGERGKQRFFFTMPTGNRH